jgi:hypothetical protein
MNDSGFSPWINLWSEGKGSDFVSSGITFIHPTDREYNNYFKGFEEALKSQEVPCLNVFCPVPYTYGKSIKNINEYIHLLMIIEEGQNHEAICELCEYARTSDCHLINTMQYKKDKDKYKARNLVVLIEKLLSQDLREAYSESLTKFRNENTILLWLGINTVHESDPIYYELIDRFNSSFEERICLNSKSSELSIATLNEIFYN